VKFLIVNVQKRQMWIKVRWFIVAVMCSLAQSNGLVF